MKTKELLNNCKEYSRANNLFNTFMQNNFPDYRDIDFTLFRGILYKFFDTHSIYLSVTCYEENLWRYSIVFEDSNIVDYGYNDKEKAEYIAFIKCFQFLDTRLFLQLTNNRYTDESADFSLLKVNWTHLDKVLSYRRHNLI